MKAVTNQKKQAYFVFDVEHDFLRSVLRLADSCITNVAHTLQKYYLGSIFVKYHKRSINLFKQLQNSKAQNRGIACGGSGGGCTPPKLAENSSVVLNL